MRFITIVLSTLITLGISSVTDAEEKYPTAEDFCFPVGTQCQHPVGYYNAQGFHELNTSYGGYHLGEDWNGIGGGSSDLGDPVFAIGHGKVVFAKNMNGKWGNVVIIHHRMKNGSLINSLYAHLRNMFVQAGSIVKKRQKIGEIGDANGIYKGKAHLHFEIRVDATTEQYPGSGYSYKSGVIHKYTDPSDFIYAHSTPLFTYVGAAVCTQLAGGKETNWMQKCKDPKKTFEPHSDVTVLATLKEVWLSHRFKVEAYKNGKFQWYHVTDWNKVDSISGWRHAQFWPRLFDAHAGKWVFKLFVGFDEQSYHYLDSVSFEVKVKDGPKKPYIFSGVKLCKGIGGPDPHWNFWCNGETYEFKEGETVFSLLKITNVWAHHRFRIRTYRNGTYQWEWTTGWNHIDLASGWKQAYFWPALYSAKKGNWFFDFFVGLKDGTYNYHGSVSFVVK